MHPKVNTFIKLHVMWR